MGKHTEEWVRAIGEIVVPRLDKRFKRKFDFRQAGPYANVSDTGIIFNDDDLRRIKRTQSNDKADFRFGFALRVSFDAERAELELRAGFQIGNKALARATFLPNVQESRPWVAAKIHRWLARSESSAYLWFEQQENVNYRWNISDRRVELESQLSRYGDLDRKSTGKYPDRASNHRGAHFHLGRRLDEYSGITEAQLNADAPGIAKSLLKVFKELTFLYELLIRDYGPYSPVAIEGQRIMAVRTHRRRERWMRDAKIDEYRRSNAGRLPCEGCGFDFFRYYGEIGRDYAQVHHLNPLGETTKPSETKLSDLAVLCANCHVMVHAGENLRSLDTLRTAIRETAIV